MVNAAPPQLVLLRTGLMLNERLALATARERQWPTDQTDAAKHWTEAFDMHVTTCKAKYRRNAQLVAKALPAMQQSGPLGTNQWHVLYNGIHIAQEAPDHLVVPVYRGAWELLEL